MVRKFLLTVFVLLALAVVGGFVAKKVLIGYLTPDFLVRQIERQWNCRAQVDGVRVRLLGTASVELDGVALAPRDEFADRSIPQAERPRLEDAAAELRGDAVRLEIRWGELIRRQLNIQQLLVTGLSITTTVNRDGDATIERLFDRPLVTADAGGAAPVSLASSGLPEESLEPVGGSAVAADERFAAESLPLSAVADRIEVKDGRASFLIEASGTHIQMEAFQLALTEIDVDPANLAAHNRAVFQFNGDLVVIPPAERGEGEYFRGRVGGTGEVAPFSAGTGRMDPVWTADLTIHQGAQINTFPVIARLQELLEKVDTAGVDLKDLNIRGTLLADAQTRVAHAEGRYSLETPLQLPLPDTTMQLQEGSWLHTGTNRHELRGQMVASEELTKKIEGKVDAYLQKKAKGFASESLRNLVLGPVTRDGRLTIEFTSRGDLAKPKADIVTPFGNLSEVIDTGKDTLKTLEEAGKSLLKNLFGR